MARERAEIDSQKTKSVLERSLQTSEDRLKENTITIEQLRDKVEKLMH